MLPVYMIQIFYGDLYQRFIFALARVKYTTKPNFTEEFMTSQIQFIKKQNKNEKKC